MVEKPDGAEISAFVLHTLFSGVDPGPWPQPLPATVQAALEWQKIGVHATFVEVHGVTKGLPHGRLSELLGRVASAGEQLGLAWTSEQEMLRWLQSGAQHNNWQVSARALAEITGYYAISAGHGLANATLRTLLVHPVAATAIKRKNKRAKGFVPFDPNPHAWVPLNQENASQLKDAAGPLGQPPVDRMVDLVVNLTRDLRWVALLSRRNIDFHRWRPQSTAGGVSTLNPWQQASDGTASLTMYATSQYRPPDVDELAAEVSAALGVLTQTMSSWLDGWPEAIRDLGVPLFRTDGDT